MLVIDRDGEGKLARKEALQAELGERLQILAGREIENTLPSEIIKSVVASYEKVDVDTLPPLTLEDYESAYLGNFIEKWLKSNNCEVKRKGGYKGDSGTVKDKTGFCDRARGYLKNAKFEDLPTGTQEITVGIYKFIRSCNG